MLNRIELKNFGPLTRLDWQNLGPINLVIGDNGSGKTFLLKAIYSAVRTMEGYKRGDEPREAAEILAEKLYWTFQPDKIGDLVTKGADTPLTCSITFDQKNFNYQFGRDTTKQIPLENDVPPRRSNSVFLPAKEVLSLHQIILASREEGKMFGFDDTYLDLARALRYSSKLKIPYLDFTVSREYLAKILRGKVEYDETTGRWLFKKSNQKFPIGVTAEGVKKIAIMDTLLGNRYLGKDSLICIDEPEAALHPTAISRLLDIVAMLSEVGIQFFLATHSYFVVKKLFLIAQRNNMSIPVLSACETECSYADLKDGMPDNPIIDESIRLYEEEVELTLQCV